MTKVGIIGTGSVGTDALAKATKVLAAYGISVVSSVPAQTNKSLLEEGNIMYFKNHNKYLEGIDGRPSKTQLKKCQKGLHEYKQKAAPSENNSGWVCIHCETELINK